jgi:hydrogenase maturation protease
VGWAVVGQVARLLAERETKRSEDRPPAIALPSPPVPVGAMATIGAVEVDCISLGGLALMERLVGYEKAILVDSLVTGAHSPGHVETHQLGDLPDLSAGHTTSAHDTSLQTALETGRRMGATLPLASSIAVVTVEAVQVSDFAGEMTPEVTAAVPEAAAAVLALLGQLTPRG